LKATASDLNKWPRLVQLGYIVSNFDGLILEKKGFNIKPEGFNIPKAAAAAADFHGNIHQHALEYVVSILSLIEPFFNQWEKVKIIVGHNIDFEDKLLGYELIRVG
jgi:hypothetical protein